MKRRELVSVDIHWAWFVLQQAPGAFEVSGALALEIRGGYTISIPVVDNANASHSPIGIADVIPGNVQHSGVSCTMQWGR